VERDFVRWLRQRLPRIGDDAAVLDWPADRLIVTSDMLMDGTDFELDRCDPQRAGRKALAVNLSDLAAMAARPMAAVVSVALPRSQRLDFAQQFYRGIFRLAEEFQVEVVGGDTNSWSGPLVVSIALLGEASGPGPLCRSGGRPGDDLLVTGQLGGSLLGHHLDFTPRVREALTLHAAYPLHAAIDISDGLSLDLSRLAEESGCGASLDLDQIPISPDAHRLAEQVPGLSALDRALGDGEDFELLLAVPPEVTRRMLDDRLVNIPLTRIGQLIAAPGLWARRSGQEPVPLEPRGYEH
jgi:thiamine-monophosphate kinase